MSEAGGVLDLFGQVNRKRTRLPLYPEQLRRARVCIKRNGDVTAELFTDVKSCPAATVELPQEENPARPFTAKPRPVAVCSAKMPIPASALAVPWTPFPPPVLPSTPIPLPIGCTGGWPPGGTSVL
jgi:hypothetical protein